MSSSMPRGRASLQVIPASEVPARAPRATARTAKKADDEPAMGSTQRTVLSITDTQMAELRRHLQAEQAAVSNTEVSGRTRLLADSHVLLAEDVAIVHAFERRDVKAAVRLTVEHLKPVERNLRLNPHETDLAQVLKP